MKFAIFRSLEIDFRLHPRRRTEAAVFDSPYQIHTRRLMNRAVSGSSILVVGDDPRLAAPLGRVLAADGNDALRRARKGPRVVARRRRSVFLDSNVVRRNVGMAVRALEASLLSRQVAPARVALVLRRALSDRRGH